MNRDEMQQRGIDWDLEGCLEFNPQDGFRLEDIESVLAVWEGENDGDDWRWILQLKDERIIFLQGGCDYTGWDCRSWADHIVCVTVEQALNSPELGQWNNNHEEVIAELTKQIGDQEKRKTFFERMDGEFPDVPTIE